MEEDPRESILKYAEAAEKEPKFISPAYAETSRSLSLQNLIMKMKSDNAVMYLKQSS